jgi:hypothetical protein
MATLIDEPEELLDLVDERDVVVGIVTREGFAAMVRGMQEELNLAVAAGQLEHLAKISNVPIGVAYFNDIYLYRSDDVPHIIPMTLCRMSG